MSLAVRYLDTRGVEAEPSDVGDLAKIWLDRWYLKDETRRTADCNSPGQDRHAADSLPQGPNFATLEVSETGWRPHAGKGKPRLAIHWGIDGGLVVWPCRASSVAVASKLRR